MHYYAYFFYEATWWCLQMETFSALLALCVGWPVNSPHKGQCRGALVFSLICVWSNSWANASDAGALWCHRAHYDVIVMESIKQKRWYRTDGDSQTAIQTDRQTDGQTDRQTDMVPTSTKCFVEFNPPYMNSDTPITVRATRCTLGKTIWQLPPGEPFIPGESLGRQLRGAPLG